MKTHEKGVFEAPSTSAPWFTKTWFLSLGVFAFACLLYGASLRNGFLWDDMDLVVANPDIHSLDWPTVKRLFTSHYWDVDFESSGLYRPISTLSFHTDCHLYGIDAAGFHLTNVLFNAGVCVLLFVVLVELFGHVLTALVATLAFAAIPVHTENVAWVAGRTDVIALLMVLASNATYARWRRGGSVINLVWALVCFAAALFAKETAVVLPALILLFEFGPFACLSDRPGGRLRRLSIPLAFIVIDALYFAARRDVLGTALSYFPPVASGPLNAAALSLSTLAHYVYKLIFPFILNVESDVTLPTRFWNLHTIAGLAILIAGGLAVYKWRHRGEVLFAAMVFALGLAPVLNIIRGTQLSAERFLYFPSLGFCVALALVVRCGLKRWRGPVLVAFALLIGAYSVRTVARTLDWRDEVTLFRKTVATNGDSARAHANFGLSLYRQEHYQEALDEFHRTVEISPDYAAGWNGLGRTLGKMNRTSEAIECTRKSLEITPDASTWTRLGILLVETASYPDAKVSFERAIKLRPRNPYAHYNLGLVLFQLHDYEGAIRELSSLEGKDNDFIPAYYFLAEADARLGRSADAAVHAARFLSLFDKDNALTRRARVLAGRGQASAVPPSRSSPDSAVSHP